MRRQDVGVGLSLTFCYILCGVHVSCAFIEFLLNPQAPISECGRPICYIVISLLKLTKTY